MTSDYKEINKQAWNKRTEIHWDSDFYDNKSFLAGKNSLNSIEMDLLGNLKGKSVLHLQCHFGQDTISFTRLGAAKAVGVDISDRAIERAEELAVKCNSDASFICCDIYDLPQHLDEQFDIVFTSYGTIGWLPDMDRWASLVAKYLKPSGKFVFAEFHPVVWMFDDAFSKVSYDYFNTGQIKETLEGTYTDGSANLQLEYVGWNHDLGEVLTSLLAAELQVEAFKEFDYSPYPCFENTVEFEPGKYRIKSLEKLIPMVYALKASRI